MPTHVHHAALKNIPGVVWVRWICLRVLRTFEVKDVVALDRLRQKWRTQCDDKRKQYQEIAQHFSTVAPYAPM